MQTGTASSGSAQKGLIEALHRAALARADSARADSARAPQARTSTAPSAAESPAGVAHIFTTALAGAGFCALVYLLNPGPHGGPTLELLSALAPDHDPPPSALPPVPVTVPIDGTDQQLDWLLPGENLPVPLAARLLEGALLPPALSAWFTSLHPGLRVAAALVCSRLSTGVLFIAGEGLDEAVLPLVEIIASQLGISLASAQPTAERHYQRMFETALDGLLIMDPETLEILYANPRFLQLSGYTPEELTDLDIFALTTREFQDLAEIIYVTVRKHGQSIIEMPLRRKDGSQALMNIAAALFQSGGRQLMQAIFHDQTESEKVKQALRESETRLRALAETTTSAIFICQNDSFRYVNTALTLTTGYTGEELLTMQMTDLVHPEYHAFVRQHVHCSKPDAQSSDRYEVKIRCKNGEDRWLDFTVRQIEFEGRLAGLGTAFDITERKQTEQALIESEEKLRSLVQKSSDGVAMVDESGHVIEWNPGQELITGIPRQEALGRWIWDLQLSVSNKGNDAEGAASLRTSIQAFLDTGWAPWVNQPREQDIFPVNGGEKRVVQVVTFPVPTQVGFMAGSISRDITENKKLESELRRRAEEAEMLRRATAALTSTLDLGEVLVSVLQYLEQVLPFDSSAIFLLEGAHLVGKAERGLPHPELFLNQRFPAHDPLFREIQALGQTVIIPDALLDPRFKQWSQTSFVRGWMGVPFIVQGEVIGYLTCDSRQPNTYGPKDMVLAEAFANQAAMAIENARLYEAERNARAQAEILREVGALLTTQLSLDEVLDRILDLLLRVVKYDSASVHLLDENRRLHLAAGHGFPDLEGARRILYDISEHVLQTKWARHEVIIIPDTWNSPRWKKSDTMDYIRSWVGAPLLVKGHFIGSLNVDSTTVDAYDETTGETVMAFANQAAIAIENARLFDAERAARERSEALREASHAIGSTLSLEAVLKAVLEQLGRVLPFDTGNIMLVEGELVKIKAWRGYENFGDTRAVSSIRFAITENQVFRNVIRDQQPYGISDVLEHPGWVQTELSGHIRSWLGVPLVTRSQVIGLVALDRMAAGGFTEDEVALAQSFAMHAATAIENARLFEQAATERRHLGLLYDVGREMSSSLDANLILERALTLTCQALNGLIGQAFIYIEDEKRLSLRALYGRTLPSLDEMDRRLNLKPGSGLAGWVVEHKEAVLVADMNQDARWLKIRGIDDDVNTGISAPIMNSGRVLGVLTVLHREARAFSEAHLALLQGICQELGLALSNAERYQQAERRLAEMTIIQNLTETFTQRLDTQVLFEEVVNQLAERLGYSHVEIFGREGDMLILRAFTGPEPRVQRIHTQYGVMGRVVRQGRPALVSDVSADDDYVPGVGNIMAELAVPIFRRGIVVGVINIHAERSNQLDHQDRDLLQVLAGQISIAMENASLYERIRSHAEELEMIVARRTAELTELYELSQGISYQLSYAELLRLLLHHLRQAVRCDVVVGCLMPETCSDIWVETDRLVMPVVLDTLSDHWVQPFLQKHLFPSCVPGSEVKLLILDEIAIDDRTQPVQKASSILLVPIQVEQEVVGFLMAIHESEQVFSEDQQRLMTTFVNQASAAVQRVAAILAAQQQHLESLVEHLPVGILLFDSAFNLLVANALGSEILAILNDGSQVTRLEHLGPCPLETLLSHARDPLPLEIGLEGPPYRSFAAQIRPVSSENQQWVLTVREVTQERENQERIQSQERLATVGQLAAGIAHDFNNIMAAILVYAELLRQDPGIQVSSREKLTIIQQQVQRATSLIRQILDFSRRSVMEQSSLDLLPFIKELDKMLGRVLPENIRLELLFQPGSYWVEADPTRLQQVFMNLALNSRDAMPSGGTIRFELKRLTLGTFDEPPLPNMPVGDWIEVIVSDTGTGIAPGVLPHIFDPFFTTKPVGLGTGLGLAQVYGIIKQHDGFIDVASEPGTGTDFRIFLPRLAVSEPASTAPAQQASGQGDGEWVLLVEDNDATRDALEALLHALNYQVLTAANGVEALERFDACTHPITLVISDLVMPRMGGLALYQALKTRGRATKLLLVTGHPMEEESQAVLETGTVRWLQKPFSVNEFKAAVQGLLR